MKFRPLVLALATVLAAPSLPGSDIQSNYWYESTISSDANGALDLLAELNYDDAQANAPVVVVMHGYSPSTGNLGNVRGNAQRLRDNGFFAISVAMRGRDGSDGVRDSGALEIHDIYDAVEAVKADPQFSGLIDPTNVHITGYSGGGGNTMSALTKFPDYFRVGAAFFGMSDYGYDLTNGWYNNGAGSRTSQLNADIGNPNSGTPAVLDRYLARASNFASKNNPYSEIHLFVNSNETICPPWNDTSFRDNAVAAESFSGEFDNITVHIGGLGAYEDFNNNSINDANESQSWPHGFLNANTQDAAELWYRDRLIAGSISQPVVGDSDELYVAGYVVTSKFDCWLGDGQNAAGNLTYSLSDSLMTFSLAMVSSDLGVTGNLNIDTARMAGREVSVELNATAVQTFTGGGTYHFSGLGHNDTLELIDNGPSTNAAPTLTGFAGVVETTPGNTEIEITFAELAAQGDETDSDGTVDAFVVQAINSGTLELGTSAGAATPFASGTNDTINATTNAYWTPASGVTGSSVTAFTVVAQDDDLALSSPAIEAAVEVTAAGANNPPTLTTFAGPVDTTVQDTEVEITFAELAAKGDEADSDGTVDAFVVQAVSNGTLKLGTSAGTATAFGSGSNDIVDATTKAYWTPASGATGAAVNAFTVVARDDDSALSSSAVQATVAVIGTGIPTVGVYDEDSINPDTVDSVASGSSLDLTETKARAAGAFDTDTGGVWNFDVTVPGQWDGTVRNSFTLSYGTSQSELLTLSVSSTIGQATASEISGGFHLGMNPTGDKVFTPSQPLTMVAATALDRASTGIYGGLVVRLQDNTILSTTLSQATSDVLHVITASESNPIVEFTLRGTGAAGTGSTYARYDDLAFEVATGGGGNSLPTLTSFATFVDTTTQDTEVELTFAELAAEGDESDSDGTVDAFVVQAVSSGSLRLGADAGSATPFATGTNETIDAVSHAYWTPAAGATGISIDAFTVVARDNEAALSITPVPVPVRVSGGGGGTASISGTFTAVTEGGNDDFNLTTLGGLDWAYWHENNNNSTEQGDGSVLPANQKSGASLISNMYTNPGGNMRGSNNAGNWTAHDFTVSDGTSPVSETVDNRIGIVTLAGDYLQVTVTLPTTDEYMVYLWVATPSNITTPSLTASLPGATNYVDASMTGSGNNPWTSGYYTLTVTPAAANDVLTLQYNDNGGGNSTFPVIAAVAVSASGTAGDTFADWIGGYDVGVLDDLDDDADGDGIDNGVENFFGTAPDAFSPGLVVGTADTGANTFTFTHPLNASPADDLTAHYRWSTDLAAFYNDGAANSEGTTTVTFSDPVAVGNGIEVTATLTGSNIPEQLFVIVEVTQAP